MIDKLLDASIRFRWGVVILTLIISAYGLSELMKLPIDAVPDITNKQVQINTVEPNLGPLDIERLVTFPVETAMAGIPGLESSRSISRNGFSQVTVIFEDHTDLYFARQQVAERLNQAKGTLPEGAEPQVRAAFVWSLYGPKEAARSIPRTLIANFVAIFAARSACAAYLRHCFGKPLIWDKTNHHVVPVNVTRHG